MEYSFKFRYGKAFLIVNIIGVVACFLVGLLNLIILVYGGFGWGRLLFAAVFIALGVSSLTQLCTSLRIDKDGLTIRTVTGRTIIPMAQIETITIPDPGSVTVKNIFVKYLVTINKKPVVTLYVTDATYIVVLTRRVNNATFKYAISCPDSQSANLLCDTFNALKP